MIISEEANIEIKQKNYFLENEFQHNLSLSPKAFRIILPGKDRKSLKPPGEKVIKMNTKEHQILIKKKKTHLKIFEKKSKRTRA